MSLGNGPADGRARAYASRFRRIKRFKKVFQLSVAQPHARILAGNMVGYVMTFLRRFQTDNSRKTPPST